MSPLAPACQARLVGGPNGYGALSSPGAPDLRSASPAENDGPEDAWSPGSLLVAAAEACFLFTLRAAARASRLEFVSLDLRGEVTVDRREGVTRFKEIVLRPRVRLRPGADQDHALRVLEKTSKACLVTAALSIPVRVEPELTSI